jgi:hypothetical protein
MLRFDPSPRKKNAGRPPEKDARGFLQWLRGRECAFALYGGCEGRIEAMHLDFAGGKGTGTKVADKFALPCCSGHHLRQHTKGWATFLKEIGVNKEALLSAADRFWKAWPGRPKWEAANAQ